LKTAYEHGKECLLLGEKFGIKDEIYSYNKMIFEKMIYNIHPDVKQELFMSYKHRFSFFDSEVINTIEEFINSGLNVSDAAKKLYVHRNTLIYRLDKIHKETDLDIRNFKDATVFIIAFLIWKENNKG
jgi:sugar diacid utilization regulator